MQTVIPTVFSHNAQELRERLSCVEHIADELHIDFMDGVFVSGVSLEPERLSLPKKRYLHAHLMVQHPLHYLDALKEKHFTHVAFHIEATKTPEQTMHITEEIKKRDMIPVLTKNPQTPIQDIYPYLSQIHRVLLMGIMPGKEQQHFDERVYEEIATLRKHHPETIIEIDGGVNAHTAEKLGAAGADILNSGSFIARAENPKNACIQLQELHAKGAAGAPIGGLTLLRLRFLANTLRKDVIALLEKSKSGHSGGSLGMADIFAALYGHVLSYDPKNPFWEQRDLVFLSNGHICPIQYAAMSRSGFFLHDELFTFRALNSRLQGHPHNTSLPGIENSGGPLAQGISQAVGAAIALSMDKKPNTVYCLMGDGELNEGQCWEAFMLAGKQQLSNLMVIIDRNNIQIDGPTDTVMPLDPLDKKLSAFGFSVQEIDGNNMQEILLALQTRDVHTPTAIIAKTVPGKGVSFMEHNYEWHGKAPNTQQALQAQQELYAIQEALEKKQ